MYTYTYVALRVLCTVHVHIQLPHVATPGFQKKFHTVEEVVSEVPQSPNEILGSHVADS